MTDLAKLPWCDCATRYGSRDVIYYCRQKGGFRCRKPGGLESALNSTHRVAELETALNKANAELEQLLSECERLRRDAERYLKLRHLLIDANGVLHTALNFKGFIEIGEREIDAAIDAASAEVER